MAQLLALLILIHWIRRWLLSNAWTIRARSVYSTTSTCPYLNNTSTALSFWKLIRYMTVLRPWHLIALSVDYTNIMLTLEQKATTHPWKQSISLYNKYLEVCLYNAWKIVNLKKKMRKIRYQQWRIQGRGALLNLQTKLRPEGLKKNCVGGPPPLI